MPSMSLTLYIVIVCPIALRTRGRYVVGKACSLRLRVVCVELTLSAKLREGGEGETSGVDDVKEVAKDGTLRQTIQGRDPFGLSRAVDHTNGTPMEERANPFKEVTRQSKRNMQSLN
jgi:hypothetical protein